MSNSLLTGLVSWWSMDDDPTTGFIEDSIGNNKLKATACTPASGHVGKAVQFDSDAGSRLYPADDPPLSATTSNSILKSGRSFTFAGWVKFDSLPGAEVQFILSKWSGAVGEYLLRYDPLGPFLAWSIGNGIISSEVDAIDTGAPPVDVWHFFVVWYDKHTSRLGIRIDDDPAPTTGPVTANGAGNLDFSMGDGLRGALDEIGFWWRVLTREEQSALWNDGAGVSYESLLETDCAAITCCDEGDFTFKSSSATDAFDDKGPTNPNCPIGYVWGGKSCIRIQSPQTCSTGWFWDGTRCIEGTDTVCAFGYYLSSGVCTACPKPSAPALTPGTLTITLTFDVAAGLDYNIFRSTNGVDFTLLSSATGGAGAETYVDTTVAGIMYSYFISVNVNPECGFTAGLVAAATSL